MAEGDIHTCREGGLWKNRIEGIRRVANTAARRADAVSIGREMAQARGVGHYVHGEPRPNGDGEIVEQRSYRPAASAR
ncbi:uncharacterized protein DUF2188 [Amycolatopsis echigonensis]|uniref:Uncharacterized protein DUF2188 n=1 Tax=Amycolatopsis echigonensis TaxID=2576905 RepID=A0A2N3WSC6_9PSEU|nr:DUF2188 domain-containing protein [Amycolatopsis niigatensis]PKV96782.1 uncharacterized protein DUF2188 [Amycolatopsis niigatensis]